MTDLLPPAVTSPAMSVLICTRNRPDQIGAAVTSVLANDHPSFDLTVIDQSGDNATEAIVQKLAEDDTRLKYVHLNKAGLSRAYNTGIRQTASPILAFTDDDCIVPQDWLRRIDDAFKHEPDGELLYGQVIGSSAQRPDDSSGTNRHLRLAAPTLQLAKPETLSRQDGFRIVGMGANFAARRSLFDRIGGFDEALGGGGPLRSSQDFDLTYRAYRAGAVILLRPEVTLLHDREPDDWAGLMRNYGVGDGAFYSKHVRCGDMYALMLLVRKVSRLGVRSLLKPFLAPQLSTDYLMGIFEGIREGFRFSVDKRQRRYASF